MKRHTILSMILMFLTLTGASLGYAHTDLVSSSPASDEHLQTPPGYLALQFGDQVRLMRINLNDGTGDQVRLDFQPSPEADTNYRVDLPTLNDGHYTVEWRAMAEDGHAMTGSFTFHVGENGDAHESREDSQGGHKGHH